MKKLPNFTNKQIRRMMTDAAAKRLPQSPDAYNSAVEDVRLNDSVEYGWTLDGNGDEVWNRVEQPSEELIALKGLAVADQASTVK